MSRWSQRTNCFLVFALVSLVSWHYSTTLVSFAERWRSCLYIFENSTSSFIYFVVHGVVFFYRNYINSTGNVYSNGEALGSMKDTSTNEGRRLKTQRNKVKQLQLTDEYKNFLNRARLWQSFQEARWSSSGTDRQWQQETAVNELERFRDSDIARWRTCTASSPISKILLKARRSARKPPTGPTRVDAFVRGCCWGFLEI